MDIAPGHLVMSDRPSAPNYIATRVDLAAPGATFGTPRYPDAVPFSLGERRIATFQGSVAIVVPVTAPDATPRDVAVTLRYQACTATRCLFPTTRTAHARLAFAGE
jgi:hypothetical protein